MWVIRRLIKREKKIDYNSVKAGLKSPFSTCELLPPER
ncbi:hypothetical protein J5U23_01714 [Saccharolobus shibatae B12]|uniref:Uncharacterized protein n=1 Tax=Saccharolobus shibatae (strain ATCC 51178 / DSM 5389 / JCM 8931 / NBRC 15437 / B12) TaxID=523848 RepID=A0A8F5GTF6_SACSH|nr:hypothetical protein J5U23_01714 [Saccharolobus shibatae B12]